jgi:DNA-binding response OmpR family regulator
LAGTSALSQRGWLHVAELVDRRKLIVVVEDDPYLTTLFSETLPLFGQWRLQIIADGQTAKIELPSMGADLILLDVGLPSLDGVSLYKILRGHSKTKHTPIVIMSGIHEWELHRMGLQTGFLLRKPFDIDELLGIIQALLSDEATNP